MAKHEKKGSLKIMGAGLGMGKMKGMKHEGKKEGKKKHEGKKK